MARRLLPQTLLRLSSSSSAAPFAAAAKFPQMLRFSAVFHSRNRSGGGEGQLFDVDVEPEGGNGGGDLPPGIQNLEEVINRIIVARAAPPWLPFVPGSSYWVPPRPRCNIVHAIGNLSNSLSEEESLSLTTFQGWPCSSYFIEEDGPMNTIKVEVKMFRDPNSTPQSEDEG